MDSHYKQGIFKSMERIPSGLFVVTARDDNHRSGMLASWVQQVSTSPPMVMVAVKKGSAVLPLISASEHFGLCQIQEGERMIVRRFSHCIDPMEDPFLGLRILKKTDTNVPVLANMLCYMECEVSCHLDIDGDHDLFIGVVHAGGYNGGKAMVLKPDFELIANPAITTPIANYKM